jgi:hypothetical protein
MPLSERCCWRRARSLAPSAKALGLCRRSDPSIAVTCVDGN